jgi:hypothetical protein
MKVHSPKEMHAANMNSQPAMANHSIVIAHERSKHYFSHLPVGSFACIPYKVYVITFDKNG